MATPFKLKSGNVSAFKNLGASPVKEVIPTSSQMPVNWNKGKTPDFSSTNKGKFKAFKDAANKIPTTKSTQVGPDGKVTVKTTPKVSKTSKSDMKLNKNLNKIADRYRTPSENKATNYTSKKEFLKRNTVKPKPFVKPKGVFGPGTRPLHPKVTKDITKVIKFGKNLAKRFLGPVGVALTGYDIGKYLYQNKDEISKKAKKIKKSRVNNPSDHGRPKY